MIIMQGKHIAYIFLAAFSMGYDFWDMGYDS